MYIAPKSLSDGTLPADILREDKLGCTHFDECGLGEKALYLGLFGISRMRYIPLSRIERVFKRLAVTKGFFEQGKIYGTLCYLVILYDGKQKVCRFTHEENLNALLDAIRERTVIPVGKPS